MGYFSDRHLRIVQLAERIQTRLDTHPAPSPRRAAALAALEARLWQLVEPSDDECAA